jgi:methionine sulfoxide reductase heme-binding subunit
LRTTHLYSFSVQGAQVQLQAVKTITSSYKPKHIKPPQPLQKRSAVDKWMACKVGSVRRQDIALWVLRAPTFLPILFVLPAILTANGAALNTGEADTLGTGSEILLILCLLVTPLSLLTRQRWFVPMRRWYGIMLALTALTDGITASIVTDFAGGPLGRITGHTFFIPGIIMIVILVPLALMANNASQRKLGKYWKWLQRLTYVVWALLWVHLLILEGFGFQKGLNGSGAGPDGIPYLHQRMYQFSATSLFLLVFRIPKVKRWVLAKQNANEMWKVWVYFSPVFLIAATGYLFIEHEFLFKGIDMAKLTPSDE